MIAMKLTQISQIKNALKTKRAKIVLLMAVGFICAVLVVFWAAYEAFVDKEFNESFWILATLELVIAAIVIKFCASIWQEKRSRIKK